MATVSLTKFNCLSEDIAEKVHNFDTDTLKIALSNTAPNATDTLLSQITQISAGNGYTTGGFDTQNSTSRSGGTTSIVGVDYTMAASGGSVGPYRYVVLYNDTATNDPLIGYWDYGTSYTLAEDGTFIFDFGSAMFTIA